MFDHLLNELTGRGMGVVIGLVAGGLITAVVARWRRHRQRLSILCGDARDTVVIHHHLIEPGPAAEPGGPVTAGVLRVRTVGQAELDRVVPNGHLASVLLHRAFAVTARDTLISMTGAEGSFLLETLTNFVCDRVANGPFDHDLYVMAPCSEPAELAEHQPITILLIAVRDLARFETWPDCRGVQVEHGSDGCRVLTLMELARRFRAEQAEIGRRRKAGERTRHVETMYVLDLALDKRTAAVPTRPVPWGRFETTLRTLNLE
ncbi:MAG TPA: hypothetical protein VH092_09120 [Urbifossiella sp.]|jgi:hypothetical protein|nr:hypothetical protein [Urbifossiella sp.]